MPRSGIKEKSESFWARIRRGIFSRWKLGSFGNCARPVASVVAAATGSPLRPITSMRAPLTASPRWMDWTKTSRLPSFDCLTMKPRSVTRIRRVSSIGPVSSLSPWLSPASPPSSSSCDFLSGFAERMCSRNRPRLFCALSCRYLGPAAAAGGAPGLFASPPPRPGAPGWGLGERGPGLGERGPGLGERVELSGRRHHGSRLQTPAGRISQIGPHRITVFRPASFRGPVWLDGGA